MRLFFQPLQTPQKILTNFIISSISYSYFSLPQADDNDSISSKSEALAWCDGLLLVYSINDRDSFNFIKKVKQELQNSDTPVLLIGKGDSCS